MGMDNFYRLHHVLKFRNEFKVHIDPDHTLSQKA